MTPEEIKEVLQQHALWLEDNSKGKKAELNGANLRGANLRGADLRGAHLIEAKLSGANLSNASLSGASLFGAELRGADLQGADLTYAYLIGADLRCANLTSTDITGTKLSEAHFNCTKGIRYAVLSFAGLGEMSRQWLLVEQDGKPVFHIGCFKGTQAGLKRSIVRGPKKYRASRTRAMEMLLEMYEFSKP